jgi:hypothetical protein
MKNHKEFCVGSNTRRIRTIATSQNIKTKAPSRTDQLVDSTHLIAKHKLIPEARKMQENAITVDRRETYVYQKKKIGRQCSCVDSDGMAEGKCQICYKTGIVGGFDKFGTYTEILDSTTTCSGINVRLDVSRKPYIFVLDKEALNGSIEWEFEVKQNRKVLDILQKTTWQPKGTIILFTVWDGATWIPLTDEELINRLSDSTIKIRVDLSRTNLQLRSPEVSHLLIRYNIRPVLKVNADWPHVRDSRALSEYGIYNAWSTLEINLDSTLTKITPEDFLYRVDRNEKWKVIESDKYDPLGINIGHNITCRLVQPFEMYQQFPI